MADTPEAPGLPPMGDQGGGGPPPIPDTGASAALPSGDSTPVTPPTGQPMTPQSTPAVGQLAKGRSLMGIALLFMDQAVRTFPMGSEDHHIAIQLYDRAMKHWKKQEPIEPSPQGIARPSMPQMPQPQLGPTPGGGDMGGGTPNLPRGPIPAPMGAM